MGNCNPTGPNIYTDEEGDGYYESNYVVGNIHTGPIYISKWGVDMVDKIHIVKCIRLNIRGEMKGTEIYKLLRKYGLSHPQFDRYKEFIRRIENPTPEEKEESRLRYEEEKRQRKEQEEKRIIEEAELKRKTDEILAFQRRRIEKLKAKNNIKPFKEIENC
jgi:hypothetical protein